MGVVFSFLLAKAWNVTPKILLLPFSCCVSFPCLPLSVSPISPLTENQPSWQLQSPAASQGSSYSKSSWNQCFNLSLGCISQIQGWLFLQQRGSEPAPGAEAAFGAAAVPFSPFCVSLVLFSLKGSRTGLQQQGPWQHEPFSNNFSSFPEKGQFPCVRPQRVQANEGLPCRNVTKQNRDIVNMKGLSCILHAQKTLFFLLYLVKG